MDDQLLPITKALDIALVGTIPSEYHMKRKDTEMFLTSLHEIGRILEEKHGAEQQAEELAEHELIATKLPEQ